MDGDVGSSPCRRTNPVSQWSLCLFHLWTRSACNAAGHLYATIAQVAEHLPFKQGVVGSNPACRTNRYSLLYLLSASKCVTCNPCLSPIFSIPALTGAAIETNLLLGNIGLTVFAPLARNEGRCPIHLWRNFYENQKIQ